MKFTGKKFFVLTAGSVTIGAVFTTGIALIQTNKTLTQKRIELAQEATKDLKKNNVEFQAVLKESINEFKNSYQQFLEKLSKFIKQKVKPEVQATVLKVYSGKVYIPKENFTFLNYFVSDETINAYLNVLMEQIQKYSSLFSNNNSIKLINTWIKLITNFFSNTLITIVRYVPELAQDVLDFNTKSFSALGSNFSFTWYKIHYQNFINDSKLVLKTFSESDKQNPESNYEKVLDFKNKSQSYLSELETKYNSLINLPKTIANNKLLDDLFDENSAQLKALLPLYEQYVLSQAAEQMQSLYSTPKQFINYFVNNGEVLSKAQAASKATSDAEEFKNKLNSLSENGFKFLSNDFTNDLTPTKEVKASANYLNENEELTVSFYKANENGIFQVENSTETNLLSSKLKNAKPNSYVVKFSFLLNESFPESIFTNSLNSYLQEDKNDLFVKNNFEIYSVLPFVISRINIQNSSVNLNFNFNYLDSQFILNEFQSNYGNSKNLFLVDPNNKEKSQAKVDIYLYLDNTKIIEKLDKLIQNDKININVKF
ncbi:hypothetical protein ACJOMT_00260 [Mycoplasmopsis synoviae]|nr:hypothetical protein [Mycoplasmopsis synoviae]AKJ20650.1 hypothetical protein MSHv_01730 [Mycoplasmopsis synoviae]AQU47970.1 hypothetical protein ADF19_01730 [Mycoplasmopsis synoviae]UZF64064.1 hypothetical protein N0B76_02185 [Mycoplasmopsis synoviae]UZF64735.1 hypothetical protein N0B75_02185 [Mycoplasmopsis synoviae]UZF65406.1 hypothetical protein N0B74_02185 [Mycoplasmopsis synoviae]